jgi:P-type conjugative transfer protein TrbL
MKKPLFILFLLIAATYTFADSCTVTPGGTTGFDAILNTYATISAKWATHLLPKATSLFWGLFGLEFLYQVTFKKVLAFDMSKLYVFFVIRIFTAYMFAHIFLNITFYTGIITYFTNLGSQLGGTSITLNDGANGMAVSPSSIMNYLECQYAKPAGALAILSLSPVGGNLFGMMLFAVLTLMISIPVALMITMIDAYVVIFGGFILCGFSGSSWTQSYWQKYLSYVGGVAIRLFVTCLILGMVIQSFSVLDSMQILSLAGAFTDPASVATYIEAMFGLLFFNVVAMVTIPNKAAGMLSGSISGGLGEVIGGASMMMSGMRSMSGMTGAASALGSGMLGAPAAGKTAAIGKARELLSNGAGANSTASSPADWKTAAKTTGANAASQSVKDGWKDAVSSVKGGADSSGSNSGSKNVLGQLGASAKQAGGISGGHSGAAELNINAHKE